MERSRSVGRLVISTIGILTGVAFLVSLASWVPHTVLAPLVGPQRIERAEAGFAIALPLDWEHADAVDADPDEWWDPDEVVSVAAHHREVLADGGLLLARSRSPFSTDGCILYDFSARAAEPPTWTTLAHVTSEVQAFEEDPEVIDAEATFLELPAGPALRVDVRRWDGWDGSDFYLADGLRWYELDCGAETAPDDRWLSVAETFEFLPVEGMSRPVASPAPQRVERPEAGFALILPYGWQYMDAAEADPHEWWDAEVVDDVEAYHESRIADGLLLTARAYLPTEPAMQRCDLVDLTDLATMSPAWATLEDAEQDFRVWWRADPELTAFEADYVALPAGRVLSIDSHWQDDLVARDYVYTDGGRWFQLPCSTWGTQPEDRWLAIAETFELLPADE